MANTQKDSERIANNFAAVIKASERMEIGTEIVRMIDGWARQAQQLELNHADGLVAHVKVMAKIDGARCVLEMLAARGVTQIGGLSS